MNTGAMREGKHVAGGGGKGKTIKRVRPEREMTSPLTYNIAELPAAGGPRGMRYYDKAEGQPVG